MRSACLFFLFTLFCQVAVGQHLSHAEVLPNCTEIPPNFTGSCIERVNDKFLSNTKASSTGNFKRLAFYVQGRRSYPLQPTGLHLYTVECAESDSCGKVDGGLLHGKYVTKNRRSRIIISGTYIMGCIVEQEEFAGRNGGRTAHIRYYEGAWQATDGIKVLVEQYSERDGALISRRVWRLQNGQWKSSKNFDSHEN
jgi:hypothetical protein